jgi:hypothetical protein
MTMHGSATAREQSPHANEHVTEHATETTKPATIDPAVKRRAQAIVNDKSIDPESRAIIRFGLEINDPWLPELVQRVDAGENIAESFDYSQAAADIQDIVSDVEHTVSQEKVEALAEIICRANDRSAAALVVLMRTLEKSRHAKLLANKAKHFAFARCAESNLLGMVDTQIAVIEAELLAGKMRMC